MLENKKKSQINMEAPFRKLENEDKMKLKMRK